MAQHLAPQAGSHHDVQPPEIHQRQIAAVVQVKGEIEVVQPNAKAELGRVAWQIEMATPVRGQQQPNQPDPEIHESLSEASLLDLCRLDL
jgi:hypothetical protein